jgi:hypothetical protein
MMALMEQMKELLVGDKHFPAEEGTLALVEDNPFLGLMDKQELEASKV